MNQRFTNSSATKLDGLQPTAEALPVDRDVQRDGSRSDPAIDLPALINRCLGNVEFVLLMLGEFQASAPQQLLDMSAYAANADAGAIRKSAHSIKGTAATLAASRLRDAAADLEAAAASADWDNILRSIESVSRETRQCLAEIAQAPLLASS